MRNNKYPKKYTIEREFLSKYTSKECIIRIINTYLSNRNKKNNNNTSEVSIQCERA